MTPTLHSLRLTLHCYTPMLVTPQHVDWLNDKDLMRYSEQRHRPHTMITQMNVIGDNRPDRFLWLLRCEGEDIGSLSAYVDEPNQLANMGILIGRREFQGQGLAAEAWRAVMDWLFSQGIHKVEAGCREDNRPMRRLAEATGMALEAKIPGHFRVGSEFRGMCLYGRFCGNEHHEDRGELHEFARDGS